MKYTILLILTFLTCLLSYNLDDYNLEKSKKSTGLSNTYYSSGYDNQILDEFIDENIYIIGPGDVFLFNMITINRTMTLELSVSPSGDVLIPVVGKVNLKDKTLKEAYKIMKNKCIQKYEDAFVYINLIKLRKFKILVIGESDRAGMHTVSSENRVSDLIESLYAFIYF